ncbi:MAG: glycosyltransferase N-terminal domain-containing protein, partial [bacterium]
MNSALRVGYEGAALLARALSAVAPASGNKLVETFAARRNVISRFESFARDSARPLLWMHAPSVGEGLQARPVIDLARNRAPRTQLAYTYFSPSARAFAERLAVDFRDVLPFDVTPDMRRALAALAPTALIFSKLDVWPTLAREACRRGTRLGLISATLSRGSSRRSGFASAILRDAYARLDRVGAISSDDADRLISLGVPSSRVSVTGDTRYDQVWARANAVDRSTPLLRTLENGRPTLVAGSTWPADEAILLPAWNRFRTRMPEARMIIAPHEPNATHLAPIEQWATSAGLRIAKIDDASAKTADIVLVDRVGVLGDLYALATVAFIGGAFHDAGLHSVLEPAAFGAPVVFGPRHHASREATLLIDEDAAVSIDDARELVKALDRWLGPSPERRAAGDAARRVVHRGLGAADRSFALVQDLL